MSNNNDQELLLPVGREAGNNNDETVIIDDANQEEEQAQGQDQGQEQDNTRETSSPSFFQVIQQAGTFLDTQVFRNGKTFIMKDNDGKSRPVIVTDNRRVLERAAGGVKMDVLMKTNAQNGCESFIFKSSKAYNDDT